jgi:hypothetical protein
MVIAGKMIAIVRQIAVTMIRFCTTKGVAQWLLPLLTSYFKGWHLITKNKMRNAFTISFKILQF